jgi:hypothetical protein
MLLAAWMEDVTMKRSANQLVMVPVRMTWPCVEWEVLSIYILRLDLVQCPPKWTRSLDLGTTQQRVRTMMFDARIEPHRNTPLSITHISLLGLFGVPTSPALPPPPGS